MDALDAILSARDLVAVLGRQVPVRLVEISTSGCLLESSSRLEKGTTGSLRVTFEDELYRTTSGSCAAGNVKGRATRISSGPSFCGPRTRASGRCVESSRGCRDRHCAAEDSSLECELPPPGRAERHRPGAQPVWWQPEESVQR